ncbi:hypothetical protein EYF80_033940 [Liparis tanakae]|uniref:Uncharacterized protein n=1 Tax=Liparis tanakae TaxID=230148 RepID=A0A4Z2GT03_9TELE|nr:hypothetical protein EYF80_033940 [Liparis tanakae]
MGYQYATKDTAVSREGTQRRNGLKAGSVSIRHSPPERGGRLRHGEQVIVLGSDGDLQSDVVRIESHNAVQRGIFLPRILRLRVCARTHPGFSWSGRRVAAVTCRGGGGGAKRKTEHDRGV